MGIKVRRAVDGDLEWLLTQLRAFSRFFDSKFDLFGEEDHARKVVTNMVENHVVFVAEDSVKGLLGFIAGYKATHPFNPKIRVLSENFWWVSEEHRGSRAALVLLNAFVEWGKANVDMICMALEAISPVNPDCLAKRGFKLQERAFTMEVA
jgi:hypothetical protein